jgi:mRNA-degrading endonuclease toxin of MazEF toxin-antitoxin module
VPLSMKEGVPTESVLKPEWIKTIDRAALGRAFATFPSARWNEVTTAVLDVLGLDAA